MKELRMPFPSVAFTKMLSNSGIEPIVTAFSGELTTNVTGKPIGSPRVAGKITDVWLSIGASGKDDSHTLSVTTDVKINGTTALTTKPVIAHVSGEASQQKTTKVTGDTGVTQRVLATTNTFSPGDLITCDMTLTRTASPTTEMANLTLTVEFEPDI